ncbi:hypothetical protein ACIQC5_19740 [Paenarthrobacter sp. NPDC092416]|uniref:hypothetical protein n=1 Tax=Paenarthrobacter sp. NPDC092416 TaxID=3364386 RepID=UPI0037F352D2
MHNTSRKRSVIALWGLPGLVLAAAASFSTVAAVPARADPPQVTATVQQTTAGPAAPKDTVLQGRRSLNDKVSLNFGLTPSDDRRQEVFGEETPPQTAATPSSQPSNSTQPSAPESIGPNDANAPLVAGIVAVILAMAAVGFFLSQRNRRDQP